MKGQNVLDIIDPEPKCTLDLLLGKFSGMELVSMMYAGIKQIVPNMEAGIDLENFHLSTYRALLY